MVTVMCGSDDSPNELDDVEEQTDPRVSVLKIETHISDERNDEIVGLHFPNSRIERKFSDLNKIDALGGFNGRVQEEYNTNPVGQYMGPYVGVFNFAFPYQLEFLKVKVSLKNYRLIF